MENKKIILKILLCVGAIISIGYVFFPITTFLGRGLNMWTILISGEVGEIFSWIVDSEVLAVLILIIIFWLPAALLIASVVIVFATEKLKLSAILAIVGALNFLIVDIFMIFEELVYGGIFINLIGVALIIITAGMLYTLKINDNSRDYGYEDINTEVCGHIICIEGEYAGARFDIKDTIIIGRDPAKANMVLNNKNVSRVQCIVKYVEETNTYTVKDMSSNGTFYSDGQRLVRGFEMQVPRGTEIYMGKPKEIFRLD